MRKALILATAALLALSALPAKADLVAGTNVFTGDGTILTLTDAVPSGNQVKNLPCIICGANQPQQPVGFGYNLFGNTGNADTVAFFSTAVVPGGGGSGLAIDQLGTGYSLGSGAFLTALGGNTSFSIGIDVNDTSVAQTLESFWFLNLTQRTVLAVFSPGPGGTLVPDINNGTGFPDYTLSGFNINLGTDIQAGDQLIFYARISGANDGPDSFFIVPQAVPGPVVGAGVPGILSACFALWGMARYRRKRNQLA